MKQEVYESCRNFIKKYPRTVAFRVKKHSSVVEQHINDDEVVLYSFVGQKNSNLLQPFFTTVVVFTNKRMLLGQKKYLGRYYYTSITPDMLNDFELKTSLFFGSVEIDTVKEHFFINCLDKRSLPSIEDALSKYIINVRWLNVIRKRKQEEEFLEKSNRALKILSVITGLILTLFYCINGGFYSLLFDLKESKTVIVYAVVIILLLVLLILCNMTDEPENLTEKQKDKNSYITVGIIILILFFAILLIFTLIDFFLPLIVLSIILIVAYFLVTKLIKFLVKKYGVK